MFKNNNALSIASVIVAIVLGAGFATGQELMSFFIRFGAIGFLGILVAGVLFFLTTWAVLGICREKNIADYNELTVFICGQKLSRFMETSIALFMFVLFSTMLSAGGEVARAAFGLDFFVGAALVAVLCLITFGMGLDGFVKVNSLLAPIMVAGTIVIGLFTLIYGAMPAFLQEIPLLRTNWAFSATLYASYNMLTAISVLCSMATLVKDKKTPMQSGLIAGCVVTLLGICMSFPLFLNFDKLLGTEIPMLEVTRAYGKSIEYLYLLILFAAIFTTAIANGFAFTEWLKSNLNLGGILVKIIVTAAALALSHAGFSNFITVFYPLFGYIGIVELSLILTRFIFIRVKGSSRQV